MVWLVASQELEFLLLTEDQQHASMIFSEDYIYIYAAHQQRSGKDDFLTVFTRLRTRGRF
jgi:hypothetical protein